jgi:pyridoxamine 5'-phosphate oxidase
MAVKNKIYTKKPLTPKNVSPNPFVQFTKWYNEMLKTRFTEPGAMALSTASKTGMPSARIVLLKGFDKNGFVFFTNYKSRKGKELTANPNASLLFYWDKLYRQVRIEGKVREISRDETKTYFDTRPYNSRIGAWASNQSSVIESREVLTKNFSKYISEFGNDVPVPPYWGGYRLVPDLFEFWQAMPDRLHDRIVYKKQKSGWKIVRLSP